MSWTYSDNDEIFNGSVVDTREDAINELKQEYGSGYVGRVVPIPPFTVNSEDVIDKAREDAYDLVDDAMQEWLMAVPSAAENELEKELSKVFNDWLKKHGLTPSFYEVVDIEAVEAQ